MLKFALAAGASALALLVASPVLAANVIDQDAPTNNAYLAGFSQGDLAQSFQQAASNVSGAGIFLQSGVGSGSADITIALWNKLPNQAGATMLASGTANTTSNNHYLDVFWNPVTVTPNSTYYLVFTASNQNYGISGDINNGYSRGQAYANPGFGSFPTYDYTFHTYASNSVAGVPEPANWALMIAGFGLAGAALRSRRTSVSFA